MIIQVDDQISLTEFRRGDIPRLVEYLADPDIYAVTLRIPKNYSVADAERWFEMLKHLETSPTLNLNWAIRDADGNFIGGIGLEGGVFPAAHRAEIGYWIGKPYWGRGWMTEIVRAVCRYGFEQLGLVKITAQVFAGNEASARVLRKCGFQQEAYLRRHIMKDGRAVDDRSFGLLRNSPIEPATSQRIKQVIVMRHDLGMRRGKQIAQGSHASMAFLSERLNESHALEWADFPAEQQQWLSGAFAKVCCRVNSEEELLQIHERAMAAGLDVHLITDSGKTEFHGQPTRTCLAIGPAKAELIDAITGHLQLL